MSAAAGATFPIRLSRGRRLLFTAIYLGLLAIVTLAGLELISRRLFQPQTQAVYYSGEIAFDPEIGWRGQRNLSALVPHGAYPVPIQLNINADGFRDASWDEKLRRATEQRRKKILILGDSLVYGWANPFDGRISEQLQARYELDGGPRAEVFNAGIPSYGPHNQLRLLPELLQRLHPDEVVLVFCYNDYADAAFPYDYRYPFRIYQPFYDTQGRLLFNSKVPRRPSLAMRDSFLGGLWLWYAVDQLRYAVEDQRYSRYGIPNARTAPIAGFADILANPALRARFPYVEPTVFSLYQRMSELCRSAGARFTFLPSVPSDLALRTNLESRGVRYLPFPQDGNTYAPWRPTLQDGHPNLTWAWILSNALYAELQGQPYRLDFREMPQWRDIPAELDLSNEQACARFLCMEWGPAEKGGRRIRGPASFFLRNSTPGRMQLEITGSAPRPTRFVVQQEGGRELCRIEFGRAAATQACALDTAAAEPILFAHLLPETSLPGDEQPLLRRVRLAPQPLPDEAFRVEWRAKAAPKLMKAGASSEVPVTIKNLSSVAWPDSSSIGTPAGAVRLGYRWLLASPRTVFSEAPTRTELEGSLQPGQATTLRVLVTPPSTPGDYQLQFDLVQELVTWFEDKEAPPLLIPVRVR